MHALRSEEEEQRWRCVGAKAISPFSPCVCVCLKIITPKGKQDYVRRIIERAKEFMESSRKRKRKRKKIVENERAGERKRWGGSGIKSKVKKKKGEDGILWVYVCGGQNAREKKKEKKKKRKRMDERKTKSKKSQFKNTTTIFLQ